MGLRITIENAILLDNGIWKAELGPDETPAFGTCKSRKGPYTVILLDSGSEFDEYSQSITFDLNSASLINIGSTNHVIVINGSLKKGYNKTHSKKVKSSPAQKKSSDPKKKTAKKKTAIIPPKDDAAAPIFSQGDRLFLSEVPSSFRETGEELLSKIRSRFSGELSYEPRSSKFEETPDNFWAVQIKPQEKSLSIFVRGLPEFFDRVSHVDLYSDKYGYSVFEITRKKQIPDALSLIAQASAN